MTKLTAKQQVVLDTIQTLGKATAIEVAKAIGADPEATIARIRRLHNLKLIHVCGWGTGAYNHPIKMFAFGEGVDATVDKVAHFKKIRQAKANKRMIQSNTYDPLTDIFHPRPDVAAAWLFTEIV